MKKRSGGEAWIAKKLVHCGPSHRRQQCRDIYVKHGNAEKLRGTSRRGACAACGYRRNVFDILLGGCNDRTVIQVGSRCHQRLALYASYVRARTRAARHEYFREIASCVEVGYASRNADDIADESSCSEEDEITDADRAFVVDDCGYFDSCK